MKPEHLIIRLERGGQLVGGAGVVACAIGWWLSPGPFYAAWLSGFTFWLGLALGCLGIGVIHDLTGGRWGEEIRHGLTLGAMTLPIFVVLFVPVLIGLQLLYGWARPSEAGRVAAPFYLNMPFFIARAVLYFACWVGIAWLWRRSGIRGLGDGARLGAPALILLALTANFSAIDWTMSLQHPWSSSAYPMIVIAGQLIAGLCFAILVAVLDPRSTGQQRDGRFIDLGSLLLAGLLLWAYLAFVQFLIIWSENLADEISFYEVRLAGAWRWLAFAILLAHFVVPVPLLLSRRIKQNASALGALAAIVLVGQLLHCCWLVLPVFPGRRLDWLDPVAMLTIGGLWIWLVAYRRRVGRNLTPPHRLAHERPA